RLQAASSGVVRQPAHDVSNFDIVGKVVGDFSAPAALRKGLEMVAGWAGPNLPPSPKEPGRVAQRRGVKARRSQRFPIF
ncbi:MAG TPA: hypothetical protein VHD63_13525, partial [Ktedonobacteraceae bacterium]|nr:hypothetical protein [Ktedonobacteraceae bacterium]